MAGRIDWFIYAAILAALAFQVMTVRDGHSWNGDFALYVSHAQNLATGVPYGDVGYVYNPHTAMMSPTSYPPVYPVYLVPFYKIFGLDIHAFKLAGLFAFAIFMLLLNQYMRTQLQSPLSRLAVVLAIGFSPWVWIFKDQILPDFLFMMLGMLAIVLIDTHRHASDSLLKAAFIGLVIYLTYGTRSLGLMLVPALIVYDFIRFRIISRTTLVALAVFAGLYILQNIYLHTDLSYIKSYIDGLTGGQIVESGSEIAVDVPSPDSVGAGSLVADMLSRVAGNLHYYHNNLIYYWDNNSTVVVEVLVYAVTLILAMTGFLAAVFTRPSAAHYYLVFYVCVLLLVPFRQDRYLLPLLPFYFVYILLGVEKITAWLGSSEVATARLRDGLMAVLACAVLFSYAGKYRQFQFSEVTFGIARPESVELFEFVREETAVDSLLVFREPRILALYGKRRSIAYFWPDNREELWNFMLRVGATHVVSQSPSAGLHVEDDYMLHFVEAYRDRMELLFKNSDFEVYRLPAG